jgi:geranylgeranyl pyrophosphate synthase
VLASPNVNQSLGSPENNMLDHATRSMAERVAIKLQPGCAQTEATARAQVSLIAQGKTAVLYASALCGAALLAHRPPAEVREWARVGCQIGCCHAACRQLPGRLTTRQATGKEVGQDLRTGRLILPLLLAWQRLREVGTECQPSRTAMCRAKLRRRNSHAGGTAHRGATRSGA